jgi:hypothetical protein
MILFSQARLNAVNETRASAISETPTTAGGAAHAVPSQANEVR